MLTAPPRAGAHPWRRVLLVTIGAIACVRPASSFASQPARAWTAARASGERTSVCAIFGRGGERADGEDEARKGPLDRARQAFNRAYDFDEEEEEDDALLDEDEGDYVVQPVRRPARRSRPRRRVGSSAVYDESEYVDESVYDEAEFEVGNVYEEPMVSLTDFEEVVAETPPRTRRSGRVPGAAPLRDDEEAFEIGTPGDPRMKEFARNIRQEGDWRLNLFSAWLRLWGDPDTVEPDDFFEAQKPPPPAARGPAASARPYFEDAPPPRRGARRARYAAAESYDDELDPAYDRPRRGSARPPPRAAAPGPGRPRRPPPPPGWEGDGDDVRFGGAERAAYDPYGGASADGYVYDAPRGATGRARAARADAPRARRPDAPAGWLPSAAADGAADAYDLRADAVVDVPGSVEVDASAAAPLPELDEEKPPVDGAAERRAAAELALPPQPVSPSPAALAARTTQPSDEERVARMARRRAERALAASVSRKLVALREQTERTALSLEERLDVLSTQREEVQLQLDAAQALQAQMDAAAAAAPDAATAEAAAGSRRARLSEQRARCQREVNRLLAEEKPLAERLDVARSGVKQIDVAIDAARSDEGLGALRALLEPSCKEVSGSFQEYLRRLLS